MVSIYLNIEVIIGNRKLTQKEVFTATPGTEQAGILYHGGGAVSRHK